MAALPERTRILSKSRHLESPSIDACAPLIQQDGSSPRSERESLDQTQVLVAMCVTSFLLTGLCISSVLTFIVIIRSPLLEPDVRLQAWDKVWKAELGGMVPGAAEGWEKFVEEGRAAQIDLATLGTSKYSGPPKIAFLFLVRGPIPLRPLWEKFLNGSRDQASIYIHASSSKYNASKDVGPESIFHNRQIPGVDVQWGGLGMVRAERLLISAALQDPANQRFVLLSESCIPIRSFDYVREYLFSTNRSFITSHPTDWRYPGRRMAAMIPRAKFRKGSQWVTLTRRHAELVSSDRRYFSSFAETAATIPDESYIQTLVPLVDPSGVEPRSVSYVKWPTIFSVHPQMFQGSDVTDKLIRQLQSRQTPTEETIDILWRMSRSQPCRVNGQLAPCFLFARKFAVAALPKLMAMEEQLGY